MKKFLKIFLLLLIIGFNGLFITLYISFNLVDPGNMINQNYRKYALYYSPIRKIFRMDQVGDARYEYMNYPSRPMTIHLFYQEGITLNDETKNAILERMQFVTHKYVRSTFDGPTILTGLPEKVNDEDMKKLWKTYSKSATLFSTTLPLNIFVLNYYTPHPSYAGLVEDAYSIFLFKDAIKNVAETTDMIPQLEMSTMLHEFGHLGGANHIDDPDCIMVDKVENLNFFNKIPSIRDSYCEKDLQEIQKALKF